MIYEVFCVMNIAHRRISHGMNVAIVSIQSNISKIFLLFLIGCSQQHICSVGYSVGYSDEYHY